MAHGDTLRRSTQFWEAVAPAKADLVASLQADLAADASTAQTMIGLVDAYAEVRLFRTAMFLRLVDLGGPITSKGKSRALYHAYLRALNQETRLAQILGLTRKEKKLSLAEYFNQPTSAPAADTQGHERSNAQAVSPDQDAHASERKLTPSVRDESIGTGRKSDDAGDAP